MRSAVEDVVELATAPYEDDDHEHEAESKRNVFELFSSDRGRLKLQRDRAGSAAVDGLRCHA